MGSIYLLCESNLIIRVADPSPLDVLQYRDLVLAGVKGGACKNQIRELALKSQYSWGRSGPAAPPPITLSLGTVNARVGANTKLPAGVLLQEHTGALEEFLALGSVLASECTSLGALGRKLAQ